MANKKVNINISDKEQIYIDGTTGEKLTREEFLQKHSRKHRAKQGVQNNKKEAQGNPPKKEKKEENKENA